MSCRFIVVVCLLLPFFSIAGSSIASAPNSNNNSIVINIPANSCCDGKPAVLNGLKNGNLEITLDKKFDGSDLVQIVLGVITLGSVFVAGVVSHRANQQKERELKSEFVRNRIDWMQSVRLAIVDISEIILKIQQKNHEINAGPQKLLKIKEEDLQDDSIDPFDYYYVEFLSKLDNLAILLNPCDESHKKLIHAIGDLVDKVINGPVSYLEFYQMKNEVIMLSRFIIRLEWSRSKYDMGIKNEKNGADVSLDELVEQWTGRVEDFADVWKKYG